MPFSSSLLLAVVLAVQACFVPFYTLLLKDLGYGWMVVGAIVSITRMFALVANPLLCALADYLGPQHHRRFLAASSLGAAVAMVGFGLSTRGVAEQQPADGHGVGPTFTSTSEPLALSAAGGAALKGVLSAPHATTAVAIVAAAPPLLVPLLFLIVYIVLASPKMAIVDTIVLADCAAADNNSKALLQRRGGGGSQQQRPKVAAISPKANAGSISPTLGPRDGAGGLSRSISLEKKISTMGGEEDDAIPLTSAAAKIGVAVDATSPSPDAADSSPSAASYPYQRLWGSIAWGGVSLLVGLALKHYGAGGGSCGGGAAATEAAAAACEGRWPTSTIILAMHTASLVILAVALIATGGGGGVGSDPAKTPPVKEAAVGYLHRAASHLSRLLASAEARRAAMGTVTAALRAVIAQYKAIYARPEITIPILFGVGVVGIAESIVGNIYFVYLRERYAVDPLLLSYILCVNAACEVIGFMVAGRLVKRQRKLLPRWLPMPAVGALCYCAKVLAYATLDDPWHVLYAEPLHGVFFCFVWTAMIEHLGAVWAEGEHSNHHAAVGGMGGGQKESCGGGAVLLPPTSPDEDSSGAARTKGEVLLVQPQSAQLTSRGGHGLGAVAGTTVVTASEFEDGPPPTIARAHGGCAAGMHDGEAAANHSHAPPAAAALATLWIWFGSVPSVIAGIVASLLVRELGAIAALYVAAGMSAISGCVFGVCNVAGLLRTRYERGTLS